MSLSTPRFAPALEARFRAGRLAALAEINATTFGLVAILVLGFAWWDWFVDPVHWREAFVIRAAGAVVIVASGIVQRVSRRSDWAALLARVRYTASVVAVSGALAVIERGYLVGVAGLVTVMLSGPYIAIDRRDVLVLNAVPLAAIGFIMYASGIDRFAAVNASIFIALAVLASLLLARVIEASNRRAFLLELDLTREARTDGLTGLLNRRALEEIGQLELERSTQAPAPLSVILCDVDHFKQVNDQHGHAAGDRAIRAIADSLLRMMRATDSLGRWGGEEFLAVLPGTDLMAARELAERMRAAVEGMVLPLAENPSLTISMGVAALEPLPGGGSLDRWHTLVLAADDAMYRAKDTGRNRVVVARKTGTGTVGFD